ncbi:arabinogalactan oligomer / maltooligosaccharide transport system permease protein [Sulfobacillus thermosulfidooxidans DSM 9293]|uniref:Maltose/maltodextrin transport system permease protein n=2 Tax=Sulfobacillus thermosulfidooxidans TaxID=28034 RepID=A0A1W1WD16_SULTA|nr:arabinogalactan oligomer / maltooligosaccharide transport system permease protein [Sulfobacillus thermosulfidooxidans DSM 9293]
MTMAQAEITSQHSERPKLHLSKQRMREKPVAYAFLAPALITMSLISLAPIGYTIYISFTNFDAFHFMHYQFVGIQNFIALFNPNDPLSGVFIPTLIWTFAFAIITTLVNYFVGLVLAVLLNNKNMPEAPIYRAILIIPWAVPSLISLLAWQGLLNHSYGQINGFLHLLGLQGVDWLGNPFWARISVLMVNLWAGFPYMMTVCLGALQAIGPELYEAAAIDGANRTQQFRYITIPAIWKMTLPLVIPSFAFNFNNFNAVYLLTGGGPPRPTNQFAGYTDILASAAYKMTLTFNKYDWAAAISVVLFIIVGILSWLQMHYTHAFEESDIS